MRSQIVKLEVTEDYIIDDVGNATITTAYQFLNQEEKPIFGFSKRLVEEFDSESIDILQDPIVATNRGSIVIRNISKKVKNGRTLVEWIIERDELRKGDFCVSLLIAKWYRLASKLGTVHVLRILHSPKDRVGYTLTVKLPKPSLCKQLIYDFNVTCNPLPDAAVNPQKLELKWRKPLLNDRFDVAISYGFKLKSWPKIFSIIKEIIFKIFCKVIEIK